MNRAGTGRIVVFLVMTVCCAATGAAAAGKPKFSWDKVPVYQYNLLNPEVRKWWAETVGGAVDEFGFDGFFMDAISPHGPGL